MQPRLDRTSDQSTDLAGKVAIVTGGSTGIGAATCGALAQAGARVRFCGQDQSRVLAAVDRLQGFQGMVDGVVADVTDPIAVDRFVSDAASELGQIDVVVNSAGIQRYGSVIETTDELWDEVLSVNLRSVFYVCRAAIPHLIKAGGGSIVNVSSVQAFVAQQGAAAYVASKGGINALTKALAVDHAADQVRVNVVCPASVDTPMLRWAADQFRGSRTQDDMVADWGAMHPLGRVASPDEIASVIAFLAGPRSSFMTGAEVRVDGGLLAAAGVALPTERTVGDSTM